MWEIVATSPISNLWNLRGRGRRETAKRIWAAVMEDRLFGHAAELGFYFLFALFPTLICASSILGLAARSATQIYDRLLDYLALVIPTSAFGTVLSTFNETAAHASSGKITFGFIAAIWSASVGISAVQDTLNVVYKLIDRRSYFKARMYAIALTIVLTITFSLCLSAMFVGDVVGLWAAAHIREVALRDAVVVLGRLAGWAIATFFLALSFAVTYYGAPDLRRRRWRWFTPGAAFGMAFWLIASVALRVYLHFFNTYSLTYGSLGAVIILLTWFYITGLMLLLGAEINSEIEAAAVETMLPGEVPERRPIAPAA